MEPWQFAPAQPAIVKIGATSFTKLSFGSTLAEVTVTGTTTRSFFQVTVRLDLPSAADVTNPAFDTVALPVSRNVHSAVTSRSPALTATTCVALSPVRLMEGGYTAIPADHAGRDSANSVTISVFIGRYLRFNGSRCRVNQYGM